MKQVLSMFMLLFSVINSLQAQENVSPKTGEPFDLYRTRVKSYLDANKVFINPSNKEAELQAVMPYEIKPNSDCDKVIGLLFVHGLSDSPYSFRSLTQALSGGCVWSRVILLEGHGTKSEDLINTSRTEWESEVKVAVQNFTDEVDNLYIVGYSAGGGLALDYALNSVRMHLAGVILFAPLLEINSPIDWVSPILPYFTDWIDHYKDDDYTKYASIPTRAMSETYWLKEEVQDKLDNGLSLPAFVVASEEDATLDTEATVDYFENKFLNSKSKMVLYSTDSGKSDLEINDKRIKRIKSYNEAHRVVSLSHLAVHMDPLDPHYGSSGDYKTCGWYIGKVGFASCKADKDNWYGEQGDLLNSKSAYGARITWNPYFSDLVDDIKAFINRTNGIGVEAF